MAQPRGLVLIFAGVIIKVCELHGSRFGRMPLLKNRIDYFNSKLRKALGLLVNEF